MRPGAAKRKVGTAGRESSAEGLSAHLDRLHKNPGELLTMTSLAAGLFLATHFINKNLRSAPMGQHLEHHAGSLHVGLAEGGALGTLQKQDGFKGQRALHLGVQPIQIEVAVGLQPKLLARRFDDGVHLAVLGLCCRPLGGLG